MVTNSAALAQRVEAARRREGVAKLHLSNTTGIKRSTLHRLLAGKGEFKVWQLIRISQHLTDSASDAEFMVTEWMSDLPRCPDCGRSMSALPPSSPAPIAYSIPDAARAVGMGIEAFRRHLASGDITRRYPNSTPIVTHSDLVEWADSLPVDKPLPK